MKLRMRTVAVREGSTIGLGIGVPVNDPTVEVFFAGDRSAMTALGEAMVAADVELEVEIEDYQIIEIRELPDR